jgi:hypothetical protein
MVTDGHADVKTGRTPAYCAWRTVRSFVQDLHEHGVPTRIDRTVLSKMSGTVATQLLTALKFLGLIDQSGLPTARLSELTTAFGTDQWQLAVAKLVRESYAPLFELDLSSATPGHFSETFRKAYPGTDAVHQKSATFFLYAAKEGGITISSRVLAGRKPRPLTRTQSNGKKRSASAGEAPKGNDTPPPVPPPAPPPDAGGFEKQLLAKFPDFDPGWSDELKAKWFQGFEKFMAMTSPKSSGGI